MDIVRQFVLRNSQDKSEGRGPWRDQAVFETIGEAIAANHSGRYGVQGAGDDCTIVWRRYFVDAAGDVWRTDDLVLGEKKYDFSLRKHYYHWRVDPLDYM